MRDRMEAYQLGLSAEDRCRKLLEEKGYIIRGTRVRTACGEIDIVAEQDDMLVIVEVKARKTEDDALYAVTPYKQKKLALAAQALLADPGKIGGRERPLPPNIRFDVMVVVAGRQPQHLENAWRVEDEFAW